MEPEKTPGAGTGTMRICRAVNARGAPVTVYVPGRPAALVIAKAGGEFICTQDTGHGRGHAACDGAGHILARWPRATVERYWRAGDCEGDGHG